MKLTRKLFKVDDVLKALSLLNVKDIHVELTDDEIIINDCELSEEEITRKVILVSVDTIAKEREKIIAECVRRTTRVVLANSSVN